MRSKFKRIGLFLLILSLVFVFSSCGFKSETGYMKDRGVYLQVDGRDLVWFTGDDGAEYVLYLFDRTDKGLFDGLAVGDGIEIKYVFVPADSEDGIGSAYVYTCRRTGGHSEIPIEVWGLVE